MFFLRGAEKDTEGAVLINGIVGKVDVAIPWIGGLLSAVDRWRGAVSLTIFLMCVAVIPMGLRGIKRHGGGGASK